MIKIPTNILLRYNTQSDGIKKKWRLVVNGTEHLFDEVVIRGVIITTKDYMGSDIGYKHHITIQHAIVETEDGIAYVTTERTTDEQNASFTRDLIKTVSYRMFATIATAVIGFAASGSWKIGLAVGGGDLILKPIIYFLHERVWRKIKYGI